MSRTLFWYILKDLLRLFFMTSGVLAGIMAFCGLLKPLTEHGLDAGQAVQMLLCFMPATQTYSLPIAALFATTIVYGRLSADNELVACRSSGISFISLTMPALVLGLSLAIISLLSLCFVVPHYTLKAEKVVFSNLAEVVQRRVQTSHELKLGPYTIFADSAHVLAPPRGREEDQVVELTGAMFIRHGKDGDGADPQVPSEFWMARSVTAFIHQIGDEVEFSAVLRDGTRFPRDFRGGMRATIGKMPFGPVMVPSPIREKEQFMDIRRLKDLMLHPEESRGIRRKLKAMMRQDQAMEYLHHVYSTLATRREFTVDTAEGRYVLRRGDLPPKLEDNREKLVLSSRAGADSRQVRLVHPDTGPAPRQDEAREAVLRAEVAPENNLMRLSIDYSSVVLASDDAQLPPRQSYTRVLTVPIPQDILSGRTRSAADFLRHVREEARDGNSGLPVGDLERNIQRLNRNIHTEIHGRSSFAISCLILVMVGCVLGMMFRSGNFLSAFALSAIPALLTVVLISAGQQVGGNPSNSLSFGLWLIWSGNLAVLVLAAALLWKLQRQ